MPVDPELVPVLQSLGRLPPLQQVPIELLRAGPAPLSSAKLVSVEKIVDRKIEIPGDDLRIRLYYGGTDPRLPVLVFFHGGGWVLGSIDTHDPLARAVASSAGCIVVSVDYRLAPEHRFPAAVDDCVAAVRWVIAHADEIGGDPRNVAVAGDSAGGNLATVAALTLKGAPRGSSSLSLVGQLLIYPVTQVRAARVGSFVTNAEGYFLRTSDMEWFESHYLGDRSDPSDPRVSPLLAPDLSGMPPALVITAEYDPLRDQGEAYARRLREAGVSCAHIDYPGAIHGFFGMPVAISDRAISQAGQWLRSVFGR